jgi:simple sugar transport system ATP-binding protein
MMFEQAPPRLRRPQAAAGKPMLELKAASIHTPRLNLDGIDLRLRAGEVFGLAGLEGNGQEILLRACGGLLPLAQGDYVLAGEPHAHMSYHAAQEHGVRYLAAGRLEEGLVSGLSLTEHMALVAEQPEFVVDWPRHRKRTSERIREYQVVGTPESNIEQLSGGNQQRFLFGLLPDSVKLILMEHPTRGLDLRSTDWIWRLLNERRKQGTAIMFVSADLDEILQRSDRIAVFSGGRMSRVLDARKTSVARLGQLIGGRR